MRQFVAALIVTVYASRAAAVTVTFQDPCTSTPWIVDERQGTIGQSAGQVSVDTLNQYNMPFVGSDAGFNSVNNTVTGNAALEVVSDGEMKAYGWCYHVNRDEPSVYPNQIFIASESDTVTWFFGYAHYRDGLWIAMCVPTHIERPHFICGERR